jgi:hypothetical protein
MGWTTEGSEFEYWKIQEFSFLHVYQTGSVVHPASYPVETGSLFLEVKWPGREAEHPPPASVVVKKTWIYTSTLPHAFMA